MCKNLFIFRHIFEGHDGVDESESGMIDGREPAVVPERVVRLEAEGRAVRVRILLRDVDGEPV